MATTISSVSASLSLTAAQAQTLIQDMKASSSQANSPPASAPETTAALQGVNLIINVSPTAASVVSQQGAAMIKQYAPSLAGELLCPANSPSNTETLLFAWLVASPRNMLSFLEDPIQALASAGVDPSTVAAIQQLREQLLSSAAATPSPGASTASAPKCVPKAAVRRLAAQSSSSVTGGYDLIVALTQNDLNAQIAIQVASRPIPPITFQLGTVQLQSPQVKLLGSGGRDVAVTFRFTDATFAGVTGLDGDMTLVMHAEAIPITPIDSNEPTWIVAVPYAGLTASVITVGFSWGSKALLEADGKDPQNVATGVAAALAEVLPQQKPPYLMLSSPMVSRPQSPLFAFNHVDCWVVGNNEDLNASALLYLLSLGPPPKGGPAFTTSPIPAGSSCLVAFEQTVFLYEGVASMLAEQLGVELSAFSPPLQLNEKVKFAGVEITGLSGVVESGRVALELEFDYEDEYGSASETWNPSLGFELTDDEQQIAVQLENSDPDLDIDLVWWVQIIGFAARATADLITSCLECVDRVVVILRDLTVEKYALGQAIAILEGVEEDVEDNPISLGPVADSLGFTGVSLPGDLVIVGNSNVPPLAGWTLAAGQQLIWADLDVDGISYQRAVIYDPSSGALGVVSLGGYSMQCVSSNPSLGLPSRDSPLLLDSCAGGLYGFLSQSAQGGALAFANWAYDRSAESLAATPTVTASGAGVPATRVELTSTSPSAGPLLVISGGSQGVPTLALCANLGSVLGGAPPAGAYVVYPSSGSGTHLPTVQTVFNRTYQSDPPASDRQWTLSPTDQHAVVEAGTTVNGNSARMWILGANSGTPSLAIYSFAQSSPGLSADASLIFLGGVYSGRGQWTLGTGDIIVGYDNILISGSGAGLPSGASDISAQVALYNLSTSPPRFSLLQQFSLPPHRTPQGVWLVQYYSGVVQGIEGPRQTWTLSTTDQIVPTYAAWAFASNGPRYQSLLFLGYNGNPDGGSLAIFDAPSASTYMKLVYSVSDTIPGAASFSGAWTLDGLDRIYPISMGNGQVDGYLIVRNKSPYRIGLLGWATTLHTQELVCYAVYQDLF